jgi:hypothetical protein
VCPVGFQLPGFIYWRKPSLGHLFCAGQLPPAELLICLLVHNQQLSLPLHSLDPLHHLGWAGAGLGQQPTPWATHGQWHHYGLALGLRQQVRQGWVAGWRGPKAPPPTPGVQQLPPSSPQALDTRTQATRTSGSSWSLVLSTGSSPGRSGRSYRVQPARRVSLTESMLSFRFSVCDCMHVHVCACVCTHMLSCIHVSKCLSI